MIDARSCGSLRSQGDIPRFQMKTRSRTRRHCFLLVLQSKSVELHQVRDVFVLELLGAERIVVLLHFFVYVGGGVRGTL